MNIRSAILFACALLSACGNQGDADDAETVSQATGTSVAAGPTPPPAFAVCASCHSVTPGRAGVGPSLAGVFGKKAGSQPGYGYSAALKASGIVWDAKSLDQWLQGPIAMVPGTRMVIGVPNPEARKAVIQYLEAL